MGIAFHYYTTTPEELSMFHALKNGRKYGSEEQESHLEEELSLCNEERVQEVCDAMPQIARVLVRWIVQHLIQFLQKGPPSLRSLYRDLLETMIPLFEDLLVFPTVSALQEYIVSAVISSKTTRLALRQHPPSRAVAIAARMNKTNTRLGLWTESLQACLYGSAFFYTNQCSAVLVSMLLGSCVEKDSHENDNGVLSRRRYSAANDVLKLYFYRWLFSSVGGAMGSAVWPGWGTYCGVFLGDITGFFCI